MRVVDCERKQSSISAPTTRTEKIAPVKQGIFLLINLALKNLVAGIIQIIVYQLFNYLISSPRLFSSRCVFLFHLLFQVFFVLGVSPRVFFFSHFKKHRFTTLNVKGRVFAPKRINFNSLFFPSLEKHNYRFFFPTSLSYFRPPLWQPIKKVNTSLLSPSALCGAPSFPVCQNQNTSQPSLSPHFIFPRSRLDTLSFIYPSVSSIHTPTLCYAVTHFSHPDLPCAPPLS